VDGVVEIAVGHVLRGIDQPPQRRRDAAHAHDHRAQRQHYAQGQQHQEKAPIFLPRAHQLGPRFLAHQAPFGARHRGETGQDPGAVGVAGALGVDLAGQHLVHHVTFAHHLADALAGLVAFDFKDLYLQWGLVLLVLALLRPAPQPGGSPADPPIPIE
jgi:hypothetical protein